ncbi:unnamed protein product [Microthlaspi erraticum]|uniref:FLZ-type domain-containing protein n=1 Tax=Microthlaspi erraticum TaxID=1685480 RepID=A0A6D2L076_9BRAS|nr:unnamed protein product [Microthlaspi erraticum]
MMVSAKSVTMLMVVMIVLMGMENILVQANRPLCELSGGCELSPSPPEDTPISPSPSESLFGVTPADVSPLTLQDFHLTEDSLSSEDEDESPLDVNPDRHRRRKKKKHHRHAPAPAPSEDTPISPSSFEDLFGVTSDVSPLSLQDFHLTEDSLYLEDESPLDVNPDRHRRRKKKKHHRHAPAPAPSEDTPISPSSLEDLFGVTQNVSPLTLQDFHLTGDSLSSEDESPFDVNPERKRKKKKKKHHRHAPAPAPSKLDLSLNSVSHSPESPETPKPETPKSEGNTFFCMFGCSMNQCFHLGKDPKDVDRFDSCVVNCLETCNKKK